MIAIAAKRKSPVRRATDRHTNDFNWRAIDLRNVARRIESASHATRRVLVCVSLVCGVDWFAPFAIAIAVTRSPPLSPACRRAAVGAMPFA